MRRTGSVKKLWHRDRGWSSLSAPDSRRVYRTKPNTHWTNLAVSLLLVGLWCVPASAQEKDKVSNFARGSLAARSKEIIGATIEMPADKFDFKPSPTEMTFGQLTLHVAVGNYLYCSKIGGVAEPKLPEISDTEPKDKLVERLKASFDFCKSAFASLDDSNKSETLTLGGTKTSRAMAILTLTGTWNDHFTMQTTYLQANGRVPPTAKN
jgi:DinB superfamily